MQNGYYQVTGAMVTQFERLDRISNNLANLNTSGYKRDSVVIGDFERLYQDKRDKLDLQNHTTKAAKFFNRSLNRVPNIVENSIDFTSGSVKKTGNSLDFALKSGDLFFAVQTPSGVRLTQQSSFIVNESGNLSTKDGYELLSDRFQGSQGAQISIPDGKTITVDKSGNVNVGSSIIDTIFIGRVDDLKKLKKEGDNLYSLEGIDKDLKQIQDADLMQQGYVVMSNVNAIREMTSLIETNRLVEMYQKVMTTQMDELNRDAITKLATTRA